MVSSSNNRDITTVFTVHVTTSTDTGIAPCRGIRHVQLSIVMQQNYLDWVVNSYLKGVVGDLSDNNRILVLCSRTATGV